MTTKQTASPSERLSNLIAAALNLQQAGEIGEAIAIMERAQREAPNEAIVHLLSGLLYRDVGNLQDAETRLRRAVELEPKLGEAVQSLGLLLLARGQSEEAIEWLKRHLQLDPANPVTLRALSTELPQLGRGEEAIQLLAAAWHRTHNPDAGIVYGRYLIRVGRLEEAEALLRQVSEEAPLPKSMVEWAYALALLGKYQKAERVLRRIIDIAPHFDRAWRGLTDCYIPLDRYSDALMAAEQALAINDQHYRNWFAKANALLSLGRYAEAYEAAMTGVGCVPQGDPEARPVLLELYLQTIESLFQLDRSEDALAQLRKARREFPTEERLLQIEVAALHRLGRFEQALKVWHQARDAGLRLEGNLAPLYYETLHLAGHPDEAKSFVQPLLAEGKERRLEILGQVGLSLYERGYLIAARTVFEQMHEFAPENARFASNLGFILTGEGRLSEAEALFTAARERFDETDRRALVWANLGYLHLIQEQEAQAAECLEQAESRAAEGDSAILRMAYWQDGHVLPDPVPYPTRWVAVRMAVKANQVTLALAQGRPEEAKALAQQMLTDSPDAPWGYTMLGWVRYVSSDFEGARQEWEQALERTKDPQDRDILVQRLKSLPH